MTRTHCREDLGPWIIAFLTDRQRARYRGCAGHPVFKATAIDSIAKTGRFRFRFQVTILVRMPNSADFSNEQSLAALKGSTPREIRNLKEESECVRR